MRSVRPELGKVTEIVPSSLSPDGELAKLAMNGLKPSWNRCSTAFSPAGVGQGHANCGALPGAHLLYGQTTSPKLWCLEFRQLVETAFSTLIEFQRDFDKNLDFWVKAD